MPRMPTQPGARHLREGLAVSVADVKDVERLNILRDGPAVRKQHAADGLGQYQTVAIEMPGANLLALFLAPKFFQQGARVHREVIHANTHSTMDGIGNRGHRRNYGHFTRSSDSKGMSRIGHLDNHSVDHGKV